MPVFIANLSTLSICPANCLLQAARLLPFKNKETRTSGCIRILGASRSLHAAGERPRIVGPGSPGRRSPGHPRAGSRLVLVGEGLSPRRHPSLLSALELSSALRFDPAPRAKSGHQSKEGQGQSGGRRWERTNAPARPGLASGCSPALRPSAGRSQSRLLSTRAHTQKFPNRSLWRDKRQKLRFGASARAFSPQERAGRSCPKRSERGALPESRGLCSLGGLGGAGASGSRHLPTGKSRPCGPFSGQYSIPLAITSLPATFPVHCVLSRATPSSNSHL